MSLDQIATEDLLAKLGPVALRRYLDKIVVEDFSAFVMKVFETVSPGDVFLPNCQAASILGWRPCLPQRGDQEDASRSWIEERPP